MNFKTLLEQKYELLVDYLKKNNKKLMEGSFNVELSLRKQLNEGISFKVMHTDIGNYYYVNDIEIDLNKKIVKVVYFEAGDMHVQRNSLNII